MTGFKPGEIVDITIKGVRVASLAPVRDDGRDNPVIITDERGNLYALPPQAAITRVAPDVQSGDLWRDRLGALWFASYRGEPHVRMTRADGRHGSVADIVDSYGPLTLVHREETADEHPGDHAGCNDLGCPCYENPAAWIAPNGVRWDLKARYVDLAGRFWHWAGGFEHEAQGVHPLMSCEQGETDLPLIDCPELRPT